MPEHSVSISLTQEQHIALLRRIDDLEALHEAARPNALIFISFWIFLGLLWGLFIGWLVWG